MAQLLYLTETQQQKPEGCRRTELNGTTGWCQWGECRTRFISQKEKEGKYIVILCKNLKQNIPSSCWLFFPELVNRIIPMEKTGQRWEENILVNQNTFVNPNHWALKKRWNTNNIHSVIHIHPCRFTRCWGTYEQREAFGGAEEWVLEHRGCAAASLWAAAWPQPCTAHTEHLSAGVGMAAPSALCWGGTGTVSGGELTSVISVDQEVLNRRIFFQVWTITLFGFNREYTSFISKFGNIVWNILCIPAYSS